MNKKYFFFDIDGTLIGWTKDWKQVIPESTKYTLNKLKENGHFVAIATGRSNAMAKQMMEIFDVHNMVHDGGNGITINDEIVEIEPLDRDLCLKLAKECDEKGFPWGAAISNETRRYTKDDRFLKETNDVYMETYIKEDFDLSQYENIYKLYIACTEENQDQLEYLKKLPWARYHKEYLFVEPTDKVVGIYKMIDHLKAPIEDVVVFGDDYNDLTMFTDKWTCIAMGNAREELKAKATYVTDDVMHDGIYKACKHFGWI